MLSPSPYLLANRHHSSSENCLLQHLLLAQLFHLNAVAPITVITLQTLHMLHTLRTLHTLQITIALPSSSLQSCTTPKKTKKHLIGNLIIYTLHANLETIQLIIPEPTEALLQHDIF